jgi:hypothetical protein
MRSVDGVSALLFGLVWLRLAATASADQMNAERTRSSYVWELEEVEDCALVLLHVYVCQRSAPSLTTV